MCKFQCGIQACNDSSFEKQRDIRPLHNPLCNCGQRLHCCDFADRRKHLLPNTHVSGNKITRKACLFPRPQADPHVGAALKRCGWHTRPLVLPRIADQRIRKNASAQLETFRCTCPRQKQTEKCARVDSRYMNAWLHQHLWSRTAQLTQADNRISNVTQRSLVSVELLARAVCVNFLQTKA